MLFTLEGMVREPGNTCMTALAEFARTHRFATFEYRVNDSKGCGGVMRAAPAAVWSHAPAEAFHVAAGTAALTHSHPSGYLTIGVYAVLATDNLHDAMLLSVNHSGDSDSTGIVCGNIAGAVYGTRVVPQEWLNTLELHDVIRRLSEDAFAEFSPDPPTDAAWTQRYPAWCPRPKQETRR
ncbi:ADP-ribosylglycohydrolase family protein [Haloactinomyces albus]|nr:ADP-ribosylglycohydrolase family protein [Haloactinomyces albus]